MNAMFAEIAARLLSDLVTPDVIAAAEAGKQPTALWQAIENNGFGLAAAPADRGGVGGTWHDAYGLIVASGRYAAPIPLAETVLANWLLGQVGIDAVSGPATVAVADASASFDGRFSGVLPDVPWGGAARHVVTSVAGRLVLLRTADAQCESALNLAREPRDRLRFEGAAVVESRPLGNLPDDIVLLGGAMIRAAQTAGALQSLLAVAVDHAGQRVQFGKPIVRFQAIQHQIAVLAEHAALVSAAGEAAFAVPPSFLPTAAAKSVACEASGLGPSVAHAVLGAMGFTYEHPLHFTTRRLWSWRSEFGSQTYWAQRLGETVCANGANALWPALTTE